MSNESHLNLLMLATVCEYESFVNNTWSTKSISKYIVFEPPAKTAHSHKMNTRQTTRMISYKNHN